MNKGQEIIVGFGPIIDQRSKILILGSMPSVTSLVQTQYYGHQQNYFWPMMFELFGREDSQSYDEKITLLLEKRIALWDVIASCQRQGSLDSDIINEQPNPIDGLLNQYPNIQYIIFNGGKAKQIFCKYFKPIYQTKRCFQLPSTSPAHTMKRQVKREHWQLIVQLLDEPEKE